MCKSGDVGVEVRSLHRNPIRVRSRGQWRQLARSANKLQLDG